VILVAFDLIELDSEDVRRDSYREAQGCALYGNFSNRHTW
jgi:hypothetical protein